MTDLTNGSAAHSALSLSATGIDEAGLGLVPAAATLEGVIRNELAESPASTAEGIDEAALGVEPLLDNLDGVVHGVTGMPGCPPDSVVHVAPWVHSITLPAQSAYENNKPVTTLVLTP